MSKQDEDARIAAEVQKQVATIVAEQQKQFAKMMEATMKSSVKGIDKANSSLEKERKAVQKELDAVQELRKKAEKEGDQMAQAYFENRQKQFREAAQTELLHNLVRMHLEAGKSAREIEQWLEVPKKLVKDIQDLLDRLAKYASEQPKRTQIEGNPKLRYADYGRGGTIYYESPDANFDMWWEFAGGDALVIVDIPTPENWEIRTKLPLEQREKVLRFVGEQILQDKNLGNGSFIIGENVLTFYS